MDKIDKKVLLSLDKDPRVSFNKIGKFARISKEVAQYRFKQLVKKNILTGFFAFINTSKLGYDTYKLLIKYRSVDNNAYKKISEYLLNNKIVAWAGDSEGAWDLILTIVVSSKKEFNRFYLDFFTKFGTYFKEKELLIPIENLIFNDKYLSEGKLIYTKTLSFDLLHNAIDKTDLNILYELSINSRATFTEIGGKLNLSYWAIAQRYKKLVEKEYIICLKPRINFRKLGYSYYHLFIELNNEIIKQKIGAYYTQHADCIMIMSHLGKYSMHLEFVLDRREIKNIIMDLREHFGQEILSYELLLITEEHMMNLLR